jgi:mannitol-1-phosphate/altronate dehydrogenase
MTDSLTAATGALPLAEENLSELAERVSLPTYDRSELTPAVVHIGVGGFHRAHQAVYFDELANRGITDWGVVGVGISRPEMAEVLSAQDNLFTVVERGVEDSSARVVGSIIDYLLLTEDPDAVRDRLSDPQTRLVTLTITADGYQVGEDESPDGIFAILLDGLDSRHRAGHPPFTVLSCDNLSDAGAAARQAVLTLAGRRDPELAGWIEQNASFPGSMVDRITPSTSPEDRDGIEDEFSVADRWPVITEPFAQWVIEDSFCDGRPPLEQAGARFVDDVAPYKLIKSRLLNGIHCALGYLGSLAGYRTTDEAMTDPVLAQFIEELMREEIAPLLPADIAGMELEPYLDSVLERLRNPAIGDQLSRLSRRGSTKMGDYLLPSVREATEQNRPHRLLTLAVAGWIRYARGTDLAGAAIEVQDARAEELRALSEGFSDDPSLLGGFSDCFGELCHDDRFLAALRFWIESLDRDGLTSTLAAAIAAATPAEPSSARAEPSDALAEPADAVAEPADALAEPADAVAEPAVEPAVGGRTTEEGTSDA